MWQKVFLPAPALNEYIHEYKGKADTQSEAWRTTPPTQTEETVQLEQTNLMMNSLSSVTGDVTAGIYVLNNI